MRVCGSALLWLGLLLATALSGTIAPDSDIPEHQLIPVWDTHAARPVPVHRQYGATDSAPARQVVGASSSRGRVSEAIPRLGKGQLKPHAQLFSHVAYPLHIEELAHLYATDGSIPADFAEANPSYTSRHRYARIESRPLSYLPEPVLLERIRDKIKNSLNQHGIPLMTAESHRLKYSEGVFLLPPLERANDGRWRMPAGVLDPKLAVIPNNRLIKNPQHPSLYKLDVEVGGSTRHVLAIPVRQSWHTVLAFNDVDSSFWFFYESRLTNEGTSRKSLSFLGAMFLPKATETFLQRSGTMAMFHPH